MLPHQDGSSRTLYWFVQNFSTDEPNCGGKASPRQQYVRAFLTASPPTRTRIIHALDQWPKETLESKGILNSIFAFYLSPGQKVH